MSTFPNALSPKKAQSHKISIFFFSKLDLSLASARNPVTQKLEMLLFSYQTKHAIER